MTTSTHAPTAALHTRSGASHIELVAQPWTAPPRREPISVWALLKDALNNRNNAAAARSQVTVDQAFISTRPAPLLLLPQARDEVQVDRRSEPLEQRQALQKKSHALNTIGLDQPTVADMIESLWGRQACSDYIQTLVMSGGDGMESNSQRLKLDTLTALLELDGLHDIVLGELRDAAGKGRRSLGSH